MKRDPIEDQLVGTLLEEGLLRRPSALRRTAPLLALILLGAVTITVERRLRVPQSNPSVVGSTLATRAPAQEFLIWF